MKPHINIHTHSISNQWSIRNHMAAPPTGMDSPFSWGIHPLFPNHGNYPEAQIQSCLGSDSCVAVGECGFDPASTLDISAQKRLFETHVSWSERYHLPLIIHCVKFYHLLPALRKQLTPRQSWIVHGFRKKAQLAKQLTNAGICLSFGAALINKSEQLAKCLATVPEDMLFLETDESTASIAEVYHSAAELLGCAEEELINRIYKNYEIHFNGKGMVGADGAAH